MPAQQQHDQCRVDCRVDKVVRQVKQTPQTLLPNLWSIPHPKKLCRAVSEPVLCSRYRLSCGLPWLELPEVATSSVVHLTGDVRYQGQRQIATCHQVVSSTALQSGHNQPASRL